jgi:hypothetical protein
MGRLQKHVQLLRWPLGHLGLLHPKYHLHVLTARSILHHHSVGQHGLYKAARGEHLRYLACFIYICFHLVRSSERCLPSALYALGYHRYAFKDE